MKTTEFSIPETLYKYEPFSVNALTNLKKQIVYFGSPEGFNDPYDCAISPILSKLKSSEIEHIRAGYLRIPSLPEHLRNEFLALSRSEFGALLYRNSRKVLNDSISQFIKERGVTCFSEKNDDLLMWSHYGGRYKGFCLAFSTSAELFSKAKKVQYVTTPPTLKIADLVPDVQADIVRELFCTKSSAWRYEKEWRCIHNNAGREFGYPAEALTGIYFGPDIDQQSIEIVCLILRGQNAHVRFWKGHRSEHEFRVIFEEFTYTSFLDAKVLGLR